MHSSKKKKKNTRFFLIRKSPLNSFHKKNVRLKNLACLPLSKRFRSSKFVTKDRTSRGKQEMFESNKLVEGITMESP